VSELRPIDRIAGTAIPVRGNNIDTDRIIPARYLKAITFDGLGEHAFEDDRASMPDHPFANPAYAGASILIVNENFGSGSSREHAPQALKRWGIDACVGQSFSEIFLGNATTIGLPCATAASDDIEALMAAVELEPGTRMALSVDAQSIEAAGRTVRLGMPAPVRDSLLTGQWDATGLLLADFDDVRRIAASLPYATGF
jgi:3-isopropylmalate/(R)-2-methylmalate dehydratase small subunit